MQMQIQTAIALLSLSWDVLKMGPYPHGYTSRECAGFKLPVTSTVKITIHFMIEIRVMST